MNEHDIREIVRTWPYVIELVKNPTIDLQLLAVKTNYQSREVIKNISLESEILAENIRKQRLNRQWA